MNQLINAARIFNQMPIGKPDQLEAKKAAVDTLFNEITLANLDVNSMALASRPNISLNMFAIGNNGYKRSFKCVCGGEDPFEIKIEATTGPSYVQIVIDSNIVQS